MTEEEIEEDLEESPTLDPDDHERRKARRLTEPEKAEIREKYELGVRRMTELAEDYKVTRQSLYLWFKKEGIVYGSRAAEVAAAAAEKVKAEEVERFQELRPAWIEETRIRAYKDMTSAVQLSKKVIADAVKGGKAIATVDDDLKAIHRWHRMLQQDAETKLGIVLDADNMTGKDDLPTLPIQDMTVEDIIEHHRANGIEDEEELDEILKNFEEGSSD